MRVLNLTANGDARFYRQQLRELQHRRVTYRTLSVPGEHDSDSADSRSPLEYLKFVPQVWRAGLDGYDIVHANYGLTAPVALAQPTRPVVLSLWGTDLYGPYGRVSRACARLADEVIVMSEGMARDLGADSHVIPHGVDFELFSPRRQADAQADLGWDPESLHVLFPWSPTTSVKDYPRAQGVVDAARDRLDRPVELHAMAGEPHREMPTYMNAADTLLLTSQWEGSPNSTKEAMACNLPVVATDVGDVREQLRGIEHSHVCETDTELVDALVAVLECGEPSDGRERAREYSLERMGDRIVEVYESALER